MELIEERCDGSLEIIVNSDDQFRIQNEHGQFDIIDGRRLIFDTSVLLLSI